MDVHVHQRRRQFEEQREDRVATVEQHVSIRLAHGVAGQPIAHRAAVDEEVLARGAVVRVGRQADAPPQPHAAAGLVDGDGFGHEALAEERRGALVPVRRRRQAVQRTRTGVQLESHLWVCQRDAAHRLLDMQILGALGLEELAPRRRVVEQLRHLDRRARRMRRRPTGEFLAAGQLQAPCGVGFGMAGDDGEPRHRCRARQGFATEAQRGNGAEVARRGDLAGGVTRHRQAQIVGMDAAAVVAHANAPHAGLFDVDADDRRRGVEAVLQELLDDGRRALHDFAGGDLIGHEFAQGLDAPALRHVSRSLGRME